MNDVQIMRMLDFLVNFIVLTWGVMLKIDRLSERHAKKLHDEWRKRVDVSTRSRGYG